MAGGWGLDRNAGPDTSGGFRLPCLGSEPCHAALYSLQGTGS
jgi:hypothetical protein